MEVNPCPKCGLERVWQGGGWRCRPCRSAQRAPYRATHAEKLREYQIAYRVANPEKLREYKAAYRAAKPEVWAASNARRRQRVRTKSTPDERRLAASRRREIKSEPCVYCGADWGHTDHIVPIAEGGRETADNLQSTCARCNLTKGVRSHEWMLNWVEKMSAESLDRDPDPDVA